MINHDKRYCIALTAEEEKKLWRLANFFKIGYSGIMRMSIAHLYDKYRAEIKKLKPDDDEKE